MGITKLSKYIYKLFKNNKNNSNYIKLGIYLFTVSLMCMFSLIGNVIVLNTFGRDLKIESDMPKWV